MKKSLALAAIALLTVAPQSKAQTMIGKNEIKLKSDLMTPEALWAMGRIGGAQASPDGKLVVYRVAYYSVQENKGHHMLFVSNADGTNKRQLTTTADNETDAVWIENGRRIAFLTKGQVWSMKPDGSDRKQLTHSATDIEGFKFSPDGKKVILVKSLKYTGVIQANPTDLPKATGRKVTDLMYRHWDHYVESILHPFVADVQADGITDGKDLLEGEPYECPMEPFGGVEQLAWSPDSKTIAYTCRKKTGREYSISTDSDIYLYELASGKTTNLCKPADYKAPAVDATKTLKNQAVNHQDKDYNVGYDVNPQFSPDGKYVAWQSMKRDGCESDRNRLCIYTLATGDKRYVTEAFDSNVDDYCWAANSQTLYFIGVWHGCVNIYQTNLAGKVMQLTEGWHDYARYNCWVIRVNCSLCATATHILTSFLL